MKDTTLEDWLSKADWEGGIVEAMLSYGLSASDIREADRGTFAYESILKIEDALESVKDEIDYLDNLIWDEEDEKEEE